MIDQWNVFLLPPSVRFGNAQNVMRPLNSSRPHASLQVGLMSVTVFPVRLLLVSFFMLLGWPFAFTASLGRSQFVLEPQTWWRR